MLQYAKEFDPDAAVGHEEHQLRSTPTGFAADDEVYVFDDERLVLAINVALQTGRPLLIFGPPGSGKSSLAPNVARILGWNRHSSVVTARTEPEDLLWRFDALRRLNDAQSKQLHENISHYYTPGPLWRAFAEAESKRSVVLIDEIDKADPDLPNSLLGPLGSLSFMLPWEEKVAVSEARAPLVVITTNDERELPGPFLRRCIVVELTTPSQDHLLRVARKHLGVHYDEQLARQVAEKLLSVRGKLGDTATGPSTAEYLDTLKASHRLEVVPGTQAWSILAEVTLRKRRDRSEYAE